MEGYSRTLPEAAKKEAKSRKALLKYFPQLREMHMWEYGLGRRGTVKY